MMCRYHRWMITRAADARRAVPSVTQTHLATCEDCRAFSEICMHFPRELNLNAPQVITPELRQRILMLTTRAPRMTHPALSISQALERFAAGLSIPWKGPLAAVAAVCLVVVIVWNWPHRVGERPSVALSALQEVNGFYDRAVTGLADTPWSDLLDQHLTDEYQKLAEEATTAVNYFGDLLPFVPRAVPTHGVGRSS